MSTIAERLLSLVLLVFVIGSSTAGTSFGQHGQRPPNVLFISVDDLNTNLGTYGHPIVQTPAMDALAERGVRFDHAYAQNPHCLQSRNSLLTGMRPDRRIESKDDHFRDFYPDLVTLPQLFRNNGYFSARVGKVYHQGVPGHIGENGPDDPESWDEVYNPSGRDTKNVTSITRAKSSPLGRTLSWRADPGSDEEQTDGKVATQAIDLLESHQNEPFFLAVGFYRPHTPYVAPKSYFERYPLDLIEAPEDPTHDLMDIPDAALQVNPPNWDLPADTLRKAIRAYYAAVSFVDAQVGRVLDAPAHLEGTSLRRLLENPQTPWQRAAYTETKRDAGTFFGESVRTERWRYTEWDGGLKGAELYDHMNDPEERLNLAEDPDRADVVAEMRRLLHAVGTGGSTGTAGLPAAGGLRLDQNYPNPALGTTTIEYALSTAGRVRLEVHDVLGRTVTRLVDAVLPAGLHALPFDANTLPAGVYFYSLQSAGGRQIQRMVVK